MRVKGYRKAVRELRGVNYGRIYLNVKTGELVAYECVSSTSGWLNDDELIQVCTYDPSYNGLSMAWLKQQVEYFIAENGL